VTADNGEGNSNAALSNRGTIAAAGTGPDLAFDMLYATIAPDGAPDADAGVTDLTFVRDSDARQYNKAGVLEYARHNSVRNSDDPSLYGVANVDFLPGDTTVAPDGSVIGKFASDAVSGSHQVRPVNNNSALYTGVRVRQTVYLKAKEYTAGYMYDNSRGGTSQVAIHNLDTTPTFETVGSAIIDHGYVDAQDIWGANGAGWWCVWAEYITTTSAASIRFYIKNDDDPPVTSYPGDGVKGLWVWGYSLEKVSEQLGPPSASVKHISTSAEVGYAARAGIYEPVTNKVLYPEQFDNAEWTHPNATPSSSGDLDPFGGTNSFTLVEDGTNSEHYIESTTAIDMPAGPFTLPVYFKPGTRTWAKLSFATHTGECYFDLTNIAKGGSTNIIDANITQCVNQPAWRRAWITIDVPADTTDKVRISLASGDGSDVYQGDGSSAISIHGANLTEGGIADYIGVTNHWENDDKDLTSWSYTNCAIAANSIVLPDGSTGTVNTDEATASNTQCHFGDSAFTFPEEGHFWMSWYAKQGTHVDSLDWMALYLPAFQPANDLTLFNLTDGSVGASHSVVDETYSKYQGNGWYRFGVRFDLSGVGDDLAGRVEFYLAEADEDIAIPSTSGDEEIHFWGVQVDLTNATSTEPPPYVGKHQTAYLRAGYTVEDAATNNFANSQDINKTNWTTYGDVTVTEDDIKAPDETLTVSKVEIPATGTQNLYIQHTTSNNSTAAAWVWSIYAKAGNLKWLRLYGRDSDGATIRRAWFDLLTGVVGTTETNINDAGAIPCGNGWYRCWFTLTAGANGQIAGFGFSAADNTTSASYTAGDYGHAWGMQFELGSFPSSYIKTVGGTAQREPDLCSAGNQTANVDSTKGTVVQELTRSHKHMIGNQDGCSISQDGNNFIRYTLGPNSVNGGHYLKVNNNPYLRGHPTATFDAGMTARVAFSYQLNATNQAQDGIVDVEQSQPEMFPADTLHTIYFGFGDGSYLDGFVRYMDYYKTTSDDATLAALSTKTADGTRWRDEL
jgi:hypothetical protein